ncbi:endolytic transglycosylase MltG [Treponema sp.]|uniref:endolytic transglycosylase MltG n=1 Tax=Treponema sp. TaxID=166 RepID=UPI003EFBD282
MKTIFRKTVVFFTWVLAAVALLAVGLFALWSYLCAPVDMAGNLRVERVVVPAGMSVRDVSNLLAEKGLVKSAGAFYYAARFSVFDRENPFCLRSGSYLLDTSMGMKALYRILQSGESENFSVVVPEGFTMSKIARLLEKDGVCSADDFLASCRKAELLEKYGIPAQSFEGYLFPDTYFFIPQMDSDAVVSTMAENFFSRIDSIPEMKGLSGEKLHNLVVLASVVEREYRIESEAPLISSVFTNRLRNGIGLYSCATIEYILTEIMGRPHPDRITYNDLKIDSPYNTYKWAGLPAGPISNPGLVALSAAAAPAETDYYFFVLADSETGRHVFSRNFDQHKAAENTGYYLKGY